MICWKILSNICLCCILERKLCIFYYNPNRWRKWRTRAEIKGVVENLAACPKNGYQRTYCACSSSVRYMVMIYIEVLFGGSGGRKGANMKPEHNASSRFWLFFQESHTFRSFAVFSLSPLLPQTANEEGRILQTHAHCTNVQQKYGGLQCGHDS